MAKKYTNLKILKCSDKAIEYLDQDITTRIYRDGIILLYKSTGKHLYNFDAKIVPAELEVVKQMDDIGCQFSVCHLEHNGMKPIFSQLAQSNQAKYLEELQIDNTIIDSPSLFQNMTMDLSSNHLLDLSVETYYEEVSHSFPVDSTCGSPVKYYVGNKDVEWHGPENLNPATPEELQDRITIELKYSTENFHISTTHIDAMF